MFVLHAGGGGAVTPGLADGQAGLLDVDSDEDDADLVSDDEDLTQDVRGFKYKLVVEPSQILHCALQFHPMEVGFVLLLFDVIILFLILMCDHLLRRSFTSSCCPCRWLESLRQFSDSIAKSLGGVSSLALRSLKRSATLDTASSWVPGSLRTGTRSFMGILMWLQISSPSFHLRGLSPLLSRTHSPAHAHPHTGSRLITAITTLSRCFLVYILQYAHTHTHTPAGRSMQLVVCAFMDRLPYEDMLLCGLGPEPSIRVFMYVNSCFCMCTCAWF
mgnify:FL=1